MINNCCRDLYPITHNLFGAQLITSIDYIDHADNAMSRTEHEPTLVAVSFLEMRPVPYIGQHGQLLQTAVLKGESTERDAAFTVTTALLNVERQQYCRELESHGFVVVEAPIGWRSSNPVEPWYGNVIVRALEMVHEISNRRSAEINSAGYSTGLADAVLERLNRSFPKPMALLELRYQLKNEPNDGAIIPALAALWSDGYIDQQYSTAVRRLHPLHELSITKEGRRHLAENKRKSSEQQNGYAANEVSRFILAQLLSEFRERKLTSDVLWSGYEGIAPAELKGRALSKGISEVDFDLAMSDLTRTKLVGTGPLEMPKSDPFSEVLWLIPVSRNQYSYLTESGYKEAARQPMKPEKASAHIHISDSTFHNSPIGVGDGFAQTITSPSTSVGEALSAFRNEVMKLIDDEAKQRDILLRLDELEAATDKPTMLQRYNNLVATIGNHITVFSLLLPPLLDKLMH